MKYYIIAGEASGDLHASNLMEALTKADAKAEFRYFGGDRMAAAGGELVVHYRQMSYMGFVEVVMNIRAIYKLIRFCEQDILKWKPDVLVLVDYPGFNLRIARFARKKGIKVFYYISPQVWAWHTSRVKKIKRFVDKMFVILPFEADFYKQWNYNVDFVGHPLLDEIGKIKGSNSLQGAIREYARPVIALLPGSRKGEVQKMLPVMSAVAKRFPGYQFVIAGVKEVGEETYRPATESPNIDISWQGVYPLLIRAKAALVTSGTATLETALFEVPQVVCYKSSALSMAIGRMVVKVKYISLVNLIMDKPVVKELIQEDMNEHTLSLELNKLLDDENVLNIKNDYRELKRKLGGPGASKRTATLMWKYLNQ